MAGVSGRLRGGFAVTMVMGWYLGHRLAAAESALAFADEKVRLRRFIVSTARGRN
jgi:hypothetical protein